MHPAAAPRTTVARRSRRASGPARRLAAVLACAACLLAADLAAAQGFGGRGRSGRGRFGGGRPEPGALFDRFDADGDGTLSPAEIARSPLARMAGRMGIDTSKPLTRDAFVSSSADRRAERDADGGDDRGRGEDRGDRGGRDRGGEDGGDRGRGRGGRNRGDDDGGGGGDGDGGEERSRERRIFDYVWQKVDRNGDGKITPDETGDDRVQRFLKERGMDPRQTYSRDEWNVKAAEYEDQKFVERSNEDDENRRKSRAPERKDEGRSRPRGGKTYVTGFDEKNRVTRAIPPGFADFDLDSDGQLGLYEWRQWNRKLTAEFLALDADRDGFLTPRELDGKNARDYARGEAAPRSAAAPLSVAETADWLGLPPDPAPAPTGAAAATPAPAPAPAAEISERDRAAALRYFTLLDRDRDGAVNPGEWDRSKKLKPQFEQAGVDLTADVSRDAFVAGYAKTLEG